MHGLTSEQPSRLKISNGVKVSCHQLTDSDDLTDCYHVLQA